MPAIRLTTKRVEKPWGRTKLWPGFGSVAPGGDAIGEVWFEAPGDPELLIKYLFTSEKLSIQVHPDDRAAQAHGYRRGKDEAWVVLAAEPHATIAIGTVIPMTQDELRRAALDGTIEDLVEWKEVKTGDVYFSPARTIHAIGPGLTLVEVQQNVDLTYRLYDYGRPRDLHLDDGIAVSNPVPYVAPYVAKEVAPGRTILADSAAFVLERWKRSGEATLASDGRPIWLVPLEGGGAVDDDGIEAGGVWLAEGETMLRINPATDLLVVYPGAGVIDRLWEPDV